MFNVSSTVDWSGNIRKISIPKWRQIIGMFFWWSAATTEI